MTYSSLSKNFPNHSYFCGWYFHCQSDKQTLAIIPSVHKTKDSAFCTIQVFTDTLAFHVQFPSPNGGPISPDSVNNMLKRVLARAGIPKVRFHDLRHTFATIALQNGVDIKTVSGMLGHFSAGFTLDTYAHVTTSAQKEAAETMSQVLSKQEELV